MRAVETLTDEERRDLWLGECGLAGQRKALRIIDAHDADRAALVAQLEAAHIDLQGADRAIAELTRERDEARASATTYQRRAESRLRNAVDCGTEDPAILIAEVTRLTEALAAAKSVGSAQVHAHFDSVYARAEAAEARVRELENAGCDMLGRARSAEARVEALKTLLAASEARAAQWQADAESYRADATVAQDRLAALQKRSAADANEAWLKEGAD